VTFIDVLESCETEFAAEAPCEDLASRAPGPLAGITDNQLQEVVKSIGVVRPPRGNRSWPCERRIHPGFTCITGHEGTGKSTLIHSFVKAALAGQDWLGYPTALQPGRAILVICETDVYKDEFNARGWDGWAKAVTADEFTGVDTNFAQKLRDWNIGLLIVDSVHRIVDPNDSQLAPKFVNNLEALGIPVVLIHHEAKNMNNGKPAGNVAFENAYRHYLWVQSCVADEATSDMYLTIQVRGNDIPGKHGLFVRVNKRSLESELINDSPVTPGAQREGRKGKAGRPDKSAERRDVLAGYVAREKITPQPSWDHNDWKRAVAATGLDNVAAALGMKTVSEKWIARIVTSDQAHFETLVQRYRSNPPN
jgi:hypothetical protein